MATDSWNAYVLMGNGWGSAITQVTLTHQLYNRDEGSIGPIALAAGAVSEVITVTAYSGVDDQWVMSFTDSDGKQHSSTMQANIETEDANGIIFSEVVIGEDGGQWNLYFPVSSNSKTSI